MLPLQQQALGTSRKVLQSRELRVFNAPRHWGRRLPTSIITKPTIHRPRALPEIEAAQQLAGANLENQELSQELAISLADGLAGPAGAIAGLLGWKFFLYTQLEYVTAAMLTNNVPKGGASILQFGGGTKELYYYPKDIVSITAVGDKLNKGLIEQAGLQSGTPVVVKAQEPTSLSFLADNSIDAVVSIRTLGAFDAAKREQCIQEIFRVLKPGAPLIFIERVNEGNPLRFLVGSGSAILDQTVLDKLKTSPAVAEMQWDIACPRQDPHALGMAFKTKLAIPKPRTPTAPAPPKEKTRKPKQPKKGFEVTAS